MIKLQTHSHLLGTSRCAHASSDELIDDLLAAGYDGAVITNHYCSKYFNEYPYPDLKGRLNCYFEVIDEFVKKAEARGLRAFYGAEVRVNLPDDLFAEYVILGFERSFLYDNKPLYEYDQKGLFELCDKNGVLMYQAHPFRNGITPGNPKYMHGAEYFNGHVGHYNNNGFAREFCDKHDLIKMSGSDYHDKGQPLLGGILVPETVKTNLELAECIRRGEYQVVDDRKEYMRLTTKKEQIE